MKHIAILYSGGLDSLLMRKVAERDYPEAKITGLFFDHGQASVTAELQSIPDWVKVKHLDWLGDELQPLSKKTDPLVGAIYIPGRNLVFCVLAACYYQPNEIWLGTVYDENNKNATDKNDKFIALTELTLNYVLSPFIDKVELVFPLAQREWTKTDAIKSLMDSGNLTETEIRSTSSCWYNTGKPCGQCRQCFKRALVLRNFNIIEDHRAVHPLDPNSNFGQTSIKEYMACKNPNKDEQTIQKLIQAFQQNKKYWEV